MYAFFGALFIAISAAAARPVALRVTAMGEVVVQTGSARLTLQPGAHDTAWQPIRPIPVFPKDGEASQDETRFKLGKNAVVSGSLSVMPVDQEARFSYSLTPQEAVPLKSLHVSLDGQISQWPGAMWKAGDTEGTIPEIFGDVRLFSGQVPFLELRSGEQQIRLEFETPTPILIQDNRRWGQSFSIRLLLTPGADGVYPASPRQIAFDLSSPAGLKLDIDRPQVVTRNADWIPLNQELDIEPGSALDFSAFGLLDAPAGKHGRLIVTPAGHFAFANQPETRQRFYGVNFCFTGQYMPKDEVDRLADRIQRLGYNAVRLHHQDRELAAKGEGILNPEALDQLDYLIAAFAERGLYVTTDLYVSRLLKWRDLGIDRDGIMPPDVYKLMIAVDETVFADWRAFATAWLTHENPYRSQRLVDDPALLWLCLVNEGNFANRYNKLLNIPAWATAWNAWLRGRYADRAALASAWGQELKKGEDPATDSVALPPDIYANSKRVGDTWVFFADQEAKLFAKLKAVIRDDLGSPVLLTNANGWQARAATQAPRPAYDLVDNHFYVQHPAFLSGGWGLPSRIYGSTPLANGADFAGQVPFVRLHGKPYTISEFNFAFPGHQRGLSGLLTGSLAGLQDWDGLFRFAYSHRREYNHTPHRTTYFDLATDPLNQASDRATLCLYLRGDIAPAEHQISLLTTPAELRSIAAGQNKLKPDWRWLSWITKVGTRIGTPDQAAADALTFRLGDQTPDTIADTLSQAGILSADNITDHHQQHLQSETRQITIDSRAKQVVIDTPLTLGGSAWAGDQLQVGDRATFTVQHADAAVWVSSLDGQPIERSNRLLLTHLTDLQNEHSRFADDRLQILVGWGDLPHLVRRGEVELSLQLPAPDHWQLWALSTSGRRLQRLGLQVAAGRLTATIGTASAPEHGAILTYELVRQTP